jgi:hypothetical protein
VVAANTSAHRFPQGSGYSWSLRRSERFVKPRFATIRCVFVNDTALGSFIDRRD